MSGRIKFEDLKDNENLVYFLEKVWEVGFMTSKLNPNIELKDAKEKYMPDFTKELSDEN